MANRTLNSGKPLLLALALVSAASGALAQERPLAGQSFDCLMEARVTIRLSAAVTGLISKVLVDRGDIVKAGQVVATLDTELQETIVHLARIRASNDFQVNAQTRRTEFLTRKAERTQSLRLKEAATQVALDEAETEAKIAEFSAREAALNLELAKAEQKREEAALNQRIVRSPLEGIVTERILFSGEYRHDTNHLMTIAQIHPLNIETFLPVILYGKVTVGATAEIRPEIPAGGTHQAKVVVVDRVLDAASGTFGVRLELPNPDYRLPAGVRCKVTF